MNRVFLSLMAPPVAICKYGCGDCYAAPVGVFWLTGLFAVGYGMLGGPVDTSHTSWNSVLLGLALWGIAALAATIATRGAVASLACKAVKAADRRRRDNTRPQR